jgi:hypothetical protein
MMPATSRARLSSARNGSKYGSASCPVVTSASGLVRGSDDRQILDERLDRLRRSDPRKRPRDPSARLES